MEKADFGKPKRKAEEPCEKPLAVVSRGPGWGQWRIWEVTRRESNTAEDRLM